MIESGADLNDCVETLFEDTILHVAVEAGDIDMVRRLVEHGADVNKANGMDNTPFHYAVFENPNMDVIDYLLLNGADKEKINHRGDTVYQRASFYGYDAIAEYIRLYEAMPVKGVNDG
jgi:ankyrin repeat protein